MTHHDSHPPKSSRKPCGCQPAPCHCEREPDPCCDDATPPYPEHCCDLDCFVRPNFFHGHLLSADDLASAQLYVIEKNKLHNRLLHGFGVVCGLRLTCSPRCGSSIRIGEGYALDNCGHDIVVCEPACFDVIGALRSKCRPEPPCRSEPRKPAPCPPEPTCYHVVICYRERAKCFESAATPSGCGEAQRDRQATRIDETYEIKLLTSDELPHRPTLRERWRELGRRSRKPLASGALRRALDRYWTTIQKIVSAQAVGGEADLYELAFAALRRAFRQDNDENRCLYRCNLDEEIREIHLPDPRDEGYADAMKRAFLRLLSIIWNALYSTQLGDLVFECPQPSGADCIVLGTVVVKDGKIVSVCNCPREYVVTAANALQVAAYYLFGTRACRTTAFGDAGKHVCCEEWAVDDFASTFGPPPQEGEPKVPPTPEEPPEPSDPLEPADPANPIKFVTPPVARRAPHAPPTETLAYLLREISDRFAISGDLAPGEPIERFVEALHTERPSNLEMKIQAMDERIKGLSAELEALRAAPGKKPTPAKKPEK